MEGAREEGPRERDARQGAGIQSESLDDLTSRTGVDRIGKEQNDEFMSILVK